MPASPNGRPRRFSEFNAFYASLPKEMSKRPRYLKGIGIFRGARGDTAWVKINLPNGTIYEGKSHAPGSSLEIKVGRLTSWDWETLVRKHSDLQGRADRGESLQDNAPVLFKDWAINWHERAKPRTKSPKTLGIHINKHLAPTFGSKALNSITVADVNTWVSKQLANAKPGTVKRQFNTLRAIFNDAIKTGHLNSNPCMFAEKIKGIGTRQRFLDGKELKHLLEIAQHESDWLCDYILWAVHSGMRKSEIGRLNWDHIRKVKDNEVVIQIPLTKADQPRAVPCTTTMIEILKRQERRRKKDDSRVFPIAAITLRRKWQSVREKAELQSVNLHDLRRTHATHAAASGVDLRTLADRLGHSDLTMLQKHYAVVVGANASNAAITFERTFKALIKTGQK